MKTFIAIVLMAVLGISGYWAGLNSPQGDHGHHKVECPSTAEAFRKGQSAGIEDALKNRVEGDGQQTYRWVKAEEVK